MVRASSMVSRVVPGISVTIARVSLRSAFISEDLPTLGLPIIAMLSPSLSIRPVSAVDSMESIFALTASSPEIRFS